MGTERRIEGEKNRGGGEEEEKRKETETIREKDR